MFLIFRPKEFIINIILVESNKHIKGEAITLGEFLWFIGIWLLMSSQAGSKCSDYFSTKPISHFGGAPFSLNDMMSGNHFEAILLAPVFAIEFHNSIAQRANPILARPKLSTIANVEPRTDPAAIDCIDVVSRLLGSFAESVPHVFNTHPHAELTG